MGIIQNLIDRAMEITKVEPVFSDDVNVIRENSLIQDAAKQMEVENTLFNERETTMTNLQAVIDDALQIAKLASEALGDGYQVTDLTKFVDIFAKLLDISKHFKGVEAELSNASAYEILTLTEGVIHSIRQMLPESKVQPTT